MEMLLDRADVTADVLVGDIMSTTVVKVMPQATARQAAAVLAYYGLTSIPVVERRGRVVGVLSASDILHLRAREQPGGRDSEPGEPKPKPCSADSILDCYTVREIMLPVVFSVAPTASIAELAHLVERTGTDRVLVVAGGQLAGIVTTTDLIRALTSPVRS
jgi:CBS domain-containing protein